MQLIIFATDWQKQEILSKNTNDDVEVIFLRDNTELSTYKNAEVALFLDRQIPQQVTLHNCTILFNSVTETLANGNMPKNVSRINGWPTWLKNDVWEIATTDEKMVANIFDRLGWKFMLVGDDPGLISARVISMIINEAYFALGEGISSKVEIDLAMKLGTNYPYGPFEWAEKIGLMNVHSLLTVLNKNSERYNIAPALENELSTL